MCLEVMIRDNGGGVTKKSELSDILNGIKIYIVFSNRRIYMNVELWYLFAAYTVGTAIGWWMFRFTNSDREELIVNSCDQFMQMLIAGDCIRVKHSDDGEIEILTIQEANDAEEGELEPSTPDK